MSPMQSRLSWQVVSVIDQRCQFHLIIMGGTPPLTERVISLSSFHLQTAHWP